MLFFLAFVFKLIQPKRRPRNHALHSVFHVPNLKCEFCLSRSRDSFAFYRSVPRGRNCSKSSKGARKFVSKQTLTPNKSSICKDVIKQFAFVELLRTPTHD